MREECLVCGYCDRILKKPGVVILLLIFLSLLGSGCATTAVPDSERTLSRAGGTRLEQMLRDEIMSWLGTPHRMGGMSRRGIDCSGLVVVLYEDLFLLRLPRTTSALMRTGNRIDKKHLTAGDLVFFKPTAKFQHVGIYLGDGEFVHTSSRYGVMISQMADKFWRQCYLTGRRLL